MKKSYYYGAMSLGLLLTACSSDEMNQPAGSLISDVDQTFYVNLSIHGDSPSSRAADETGGTPTQDADFDAGLDQENKVNNAYFVFYDAYGQVVGDIVPVTLSNPQTAAAPDGTVNQYYQSVVPVSVRKGEKTPTGVICYINPVSPSSLQNPLSVIQTVNRQRVSTPINGAEYFAMSNSVYYPSTTSTAPQIAVPINPETQLFKTEAEAKDAMGTAFAVDVYVERYATKLTFKAEEEGKNVPYVTKTRVYTDMNDETKVSENDVVLTFTPQYWALNAASNSTYVVKSFRQVASGGEILSNNYPYNLLNYRININDPMEAVNYNDATVGTTLAEGAWAWNNPTFHRSYWSVSPAYFQTAYPEVASDVENTENPNQTYLAYQDLATKGYTASDKAAKYFMETTVGIQALHSKNPAAAVASVIYVGQYGLTVNGTEVAGNPNFFTYLKGSVELKGEDGTTTTEQRPFIYFENDESGESKIAGGESMLKRFCAQSTILFTKNADGTYNELGLDNYSLFVNALEVAEISDAVKKVVDGSTTTELKLPANARSLQFRSVEAANGETPIYIASGNGYKSIVADPEADETLAAGTIGISEANAILMQQVGYAYFYNAGKSYFNIPVKHYGWYRTANENRTDGVDNPIINWNLVRVGDFGMVRNHSYNISVNKITGLASGIASDDTPIVPPASTDDYFVAYRVNILKWAVVPTQGVDL